MISLWFPADVQRQVDLKDSLFAVLNLKPYMAKKRPKAFVTQPK